MEGKDVQTRTVEEHRYDRPRVRLANLWGRALGGETVADALARERRRIAAEVHDLVMQDLSLALASARALADDPVAARHASVVVAAGERALAGARRIVSELAAPDRKPLVEAVEAVERSVRRAARDVPLSFDAHGVTVGAQPDEPTLDALVHIGREAVTNAIKHAAPTAIEVVLERAEEWHLRVRDDGHGSDAGDAGGRRGVGGFGLASMRRHAHALGGSLRVSSAPGAGTTVEAVLP
jgi:signal transduction histidine kinase